MPAGLQPKAPGAHLFFKISVLYKPIKKQDHKKCPAFLLAYLSKIKLQKLNRLWQIKPFV